MSKQKHPIERRTVGDWLSGPFVFRIPVYQRHYAWNREQKFGPLHLFWETVEEQTTERLRQKSVDPVKPHYFGAIIVEDKTEGIVNTQQYDVVDGQQRLITINVALFAIIGIASRLGHRVDTQNKLAKYLCRESAANGQPQSKLVPTNFDKTQFQNLFAQSFGAQPPEHQDNDEHAQRSKVMQAYEFFSEVFAEFVKNSSEENSGAEIASVDALIATIIDGFELILIPLKETDAAQKVFESLNNTATRLTTFDLIRNNIFYRAVQKPLGYDGADEELFNDELWQQFEDLFWEDPAGHGGGASHIEAYLPRMLMAETRKYCHSERDVLFKEYKEFAKALNKLGAGVAAEIQTISKYVDIYKYLVGKHREPPRGAKIDYGYFMHAVCKRMEWYPVIFTIALSDAPPAEKQRMLQLLESFVIRRHICKWSSASYNLDAPKLCAAFDGRPSYEKLAKFLRERSGASREFPDNDQIEFACLHNDFYSNNKLKNYIFSRIAWHTTTARDEVRNLEGLTIDHIMPRTWREKSRWQQSVADLQPDEVDLKINTIGNLTPMSGRLNSAKSNLDWDCEICTRKDSESCGRKHARAHLRSCDLKLTRKLADNDSWGITEIDARGRELAGFICEIWREEIDATN